MKHGSVLQSRPSLYEQDTPDVLTVRQPDGFEGFGREPSSQVLECHMDVPRERTGCSQAVTCALHFPGETLVHGGLLLDLARHQLVLQSWDDNQWQHNFSTGRLHSLISVQFPPRPLM